MSDNHQALRSALTEMRKQAAMHNTEWTSEIGETNEWGTRCFEIHGERVQELATAYGESTAAYIAACNPIAIAAILSELEALRLKLDTAYAVVIDLGGEVRDPEIEEQRRLRADAGRYRWIRDAAPASVVLGFDVEPPYGATWTAAEMDAAIDAAKEQQA